MNPQAQKIYEILKDGDWHCPIEWGYADGHTKRITDINRFLEPSGKKVISEVCDCGRHSSRIFKRKVVDISRGWVTVAHESHNLVQAGSTPAPATKVKFDVDKWNEQFKERKTQLSNQLSMF